MKNGFKASGRGISRRSFLATTAAIGAGVSMCGLTLSGTAGVGEALAAESQDDEQVFNACCRPNCFNLCQLNVHVRDGKIVKTSPKPYTGNEEYTRICLRGLTHAVRVYDPERLQYPLRRVGERGANEWERISWDEAINEIAAKFTQLQKDYGPASVASYSLSGNHGQIVGEFATKFFGEINATTLSCNGDMGNTIGLNRVLGFGGLWSGNETKDMSNAKNVFIWANNLTDAQIHDWHFVADAIEAGANIIVIDPTFTQMASKAHKFVPVRHASDTALVMGMMNVIVEEDLIDRDFMAAYTCAPFLVNPETKRFMHLSDMGVAPTEGPADLMTGQPTIIDPCLVWDLDQNKMVAAEQATKPALEGVFSENGKTYRTAYEYLKDEIEKFPLDVASQITDVPEDVIVDLAHLACDGPVTHRIGWGANAYGNGVHQAHALATLGAITGQMCKPGANVGIVNWMIFPGWNSSLSAPSKPVTSPTVFFTEFADVMRTGTWLGEPVDIKALYVYAANPLNTCTDTNALKEAFDKLEFIVTADSILTDTALYSDIVLPIAQWFEFHDVVCRGTNYHLTFNDKAIDPPYECKPDYEIFQLLAKQMGVKDYFWGTDEEFLREYLKSPMLESMGIDYDVLKEAGAIRVFPDPYLRWNDHVFFTSSGRMEFYVEDPVPQFPIGRSYDVDRERLPHFFEPCEAWPEPVGDYPANPNGEKYPFVLNSERPRYRVHSQWSSNPILREIDPEPTVKINPSDAEKLGIADGSYVECFNDRGHAVAKALYNEAVRPGALVYAKSWQAYQHKAGCWSELTSNAVDNFGANMNWMDVLVAIRPWKEG